MAVTYYKGKIGQEDVEFGAGTFLRKDKDGANKQLNQINKGDIPQKLSAKTAAYAITGGNEIGEHIFTNEGASGSITFTLKPAIAGNGPFIFLITDAQEMRVDPNGTEYFRDCAAGKYKYSNVQGNVLKVWCGINGIWEWDYELVNGNWDNET